MATGGTISAAGGISGATNGSKSETYSVLELNGTAQVLSGGIVSSCGYIYGDGKLIAQSGAKLYQPLAICDYRGGHYTVAAAGGESYAMGTQSGETYISPFTRYTAQNIQSDLQMESGAIMYAYCDLYADSKHNHRKDPGCGHRRVVIPSLIVLFNRMLPDVRTVFRDSHPVRVFFVNIHFRSLEIVLLFKLLQYIV